MGGSNWSTLSIINSPMSRFFLRDTIPSQSNYRSALPDLIYLPFNIGRFIPRQPDHQTPFISPPSNSVNLAEWINDQISNGDITGAVDGNGIYSGNGTIPNATIARLGTSFGIEPTGTTNEYNLYLTPTSTQIGVGTGSNAYSFRLSLTETTATFTDDISSGGLKYAANYAANYTSRSLVDKAYVDSVVATPDGNGIYSGSGTSPTNTIATTAGNFSFKYPSISVNSLDITTNSVQLGAPTGSTYAYTLLFSPTAATFTDNVSGGGLKYAANYSAFYTVRSLVDKGYIDQVLDGRKWKQEVTCATTAPITLSGEQTIDGILTSASRVLVKNQASAIENGIYLSAVGAWARTTDADVEPELDAAAVSVASGTVNGDKQFFQIETGVTIGTDANNWVLLSGVNYTADGLGIELTGNEFGLELDGTTLSKSATGLKVATNGITGVEINASVAGDGLIGGGGIPLAVGAGTGVVVAANTVSVTGLIGAPWAAANKLSGQFTVTLAGAFSQTVSVSPYAASDVLVQLRDTNDQVITADIDTTISAGNITISGIAPSSSYVIKYVIIA